MNIVIKLRLKLAKIILPPNGYAFRGAAEYITTEIKGIAITKPEAEKIIEEWIKEGIIR